MKRISFQKFHLILTLCAIAALFLLPPLFSKDGITIPDVSSLKPFTAETRFMSLEGYVISLVKVNYGKEITHAEARKLIKAAAKKNEDASAAEPAREKRFNKIAYHDISAHFNNLSHKCEELLKFFQKLALSRPARMSEACLTLEKHTVKRVLLVASETGAGGPEAAELVEYFVKKRFAALGYEVVGSSCAGPKNDQERKSGTIKKARALGADLVVNYEVKKYERGKKICVPGMLIDVAFLGVWNKAEISVATKVYSVRKNDYIFRGSAKTEKKRKVLGLFCGSKGVMTYAANSAVNKLFADFKN